MHISGWAQRFLFRIGSVGSTRRRTFRRRTGAVLIARLMLQSADVLILDEPTNDLDIATLDVLEIEPGGISGGGWCW